MRRWLFGRDRDHERKDAELSALRMGAELALRKVHVAEMERERLAAAVRATVQALQRQR